MLLHNDTSTCMMCNLSDDKIRKVAILKTNKINTHAHRKAPLTKTHPNRVRLALQEERLQNSQLKKKVKQMQQEIMSVGVKLDDQLSSDIHQIVTENVDNASPFMKLFWEQQKESLTKSATGMRFHPMIIRFCLSIASKSASAYDELRNSKVLTLPSRRTLRDYKNAIRPSVGFNAEVVQELERLLQLYQVSNDIV